eukprot:SAG31_NODE_227_length_19818_cov_6.503271_9_plen_96_part_00
MNMIWRIRAKKRQPKFVHNGATDHPDRGSHPLNGEWLHFEQDESPYFPGEVRLAMTTDNPYVVVDNVDNPYVVVDKCCAYTRRSATTRTPDPNMR